MPESEPWETRKIHHFRLFQFWGAFRIHVFLAAPQYPVACNKNAVVTPMLNFYYNMRYLHPRSFSSYAEADPDGFRLAGRLHRTAGDGQLHGRCRAAQLEPAGIF